MGAEAFHGPVREGKGWFHLAMCTRLKLVAVREAVGPGAYRTVMEEVIRWVVIAACCIEYGTTLDVELLKVIESSRTGN